MDTHVKVLGMLHLVLGAFGLVAAFIPADYLWWRGRYCRRLGDPDAALAMPIIGVTGLALVLLVGALSLPGIIVGIGLLNAVVGSNLRHHAFNFRSDLDSVRNGRRCMGSGSSSRSTERLFQGSLPTQL